MPILTADAYPQTPATARELAFAVLLEQDDTREFATRILERRLSEINFRERALATELVHGLVRRQLTLDTLIQGKVSRPRHRVEHALWRLLQLGAYQLIFLDGVPEHAAVSETVNLAKRIGQPRWTGFANGVLRNLSRDVSPDEENEPGRNTIPLTAGRYRGLKSDAFPDSDENTAAWFSAAFSFPLWLAERWTPRFSRDELIAIGFWFNQPHGFTLRFNPLKATLRDAVLDTLRAAGHPVEPGEQPEAIRLESTAGIVDLPGFSDGHFTVQDESAITVGKLLNPSPGMQVLDLCAAPGTKTTHLAEMMQNRGRIIATDISEERLKRVNENAARLGHTIIETTPIADDLSDVPPGPFDAVLVDAPCSNTGVLGKRPEARWRISNEEIEELAALQLRLLDTAAERLQPGGRLVYSTCSIEPEENAGVIAAFLESHADFELLEQHNFTPGHPADGGFAALLRRID